MNQHSKFDIAIIGGGIAGLTAATFAARAGHSVILLEKDSHGGGRATTQVVQGFHFNQGPHALYAGGHGIEILRELGIRYSGHIASYGGSWLLRDGVRHIWPGTPGALMATTLLSTEAKQEAATLLGSLGELAEAADDSLTVQEWLEINVRHADLRLMLEGIVRLSTYCNEPAAQQAKAALIQTAMGRHGVEYLDGGWQTLVDGLRGAAEAAGVRIDLRSAVSEIQCRGHRASVILADGASYAARCVISTAGPAAAARLVNDGQVPSLRKLANAFIPVHAACLDIALRRLPSPENQFAIGLDHPWYYSVHSRSAQLAPANGALIQVAKYLSRDTTGHSANVQQELEGVMDWMQPGWRDLLVEKRFLPRMLVANTVVTPERDGTHGRLGPAVEEVPNLFLAGDWVGQAGMLVDASFASARRAATLAGEFLRATGVAGDSARQAVAVGRD